MYFFLKITSGYGSDSEITALVDQYDWKFVPIANPDGYAYTWSNVSSKLIILLTLNN
jgi:murein tripeptide amidase MpaA